MIIKFLIALASYDVFKLLLARMVKYIMKKRYKKEYDKIVEEIKQETKDKLSKL